MTAPTPDFTGLADGARSWVCHSAFCAYVTIHDACNCGRDEFFSRLDAALRHVADLEREADELRERLAEADELIDVLRSACRMGGVDGRSRLSKAMDAYDSRARLAAQAPPAAVDQPGAET